MTKKVIAAATMTALTLALSARAALAQVRGDNNRDAGVENRIDRLGDRYDSFEVEFEDGFIDEGVLISVYEGDFDGDLDEIEFLEDGDEDNDGVLDELETVTVVYDVDGDGFLEDYESLVVVYDVDGDGIDDVEDAFLV